MSVCTILHQHFSFMKVFKHGTIWQLSHLRWGRTHSILEQIRVYDCQCETFVKKWSHICVVFTFLWCLCRSRTVYTPYAMNPASQMSDVTWKGTIHTLAHATTETIYEIVVPDSESWKSFPTCALDTYMNELIFLTYLLLPWPALHGRKKDVS